MSKVKQPTQVKTKRPYTAPEIEVIQIDQEIALVMTSESPLPPPEFLKLPLLTI